MNSPTATWFIEDREVTNGGGLEVTPSSDGSISTLVFNPLMTSHATDDSRVYSCRASVDSPALLNARTMSVTQSVSVKSKKLMLIVKREESIQTSLHLDL